MGASKSRPLCLALAATLVTAVAGAGDEAPARQAESPGARPAVVVELFTSQGCSSCPPADRVLSALGREVRSDGLTLVPLAFHVDYWNRIGWVDPFSSRRWSARQRRYAEALGLRSVYTPQAVLNGRAELVGSRESQLRSGILAAVPRRPVGRVEIVGASLEGGASELVVELVAAVDAGAPEARTAANLAVFENDLVTRVESGENARLTLRNDYVVRLLRAVIGFEPGETGSRRERARIALDRGWVVENLGVAAFLQDSETLEIHAAAVLESLAPGTVAGGRVDSR